MFTKIKNALTRQKNGESIKLKNETVALTPKGKFPKTQKEAIMWHLQDFGSITSMEAFSEYGITRLSHIIYVLRRNTNMRITSIPMKRVNRYGNSVSFSKYTLVKNGNRTQES